MPRAAEAGEHGQRVERLLLPPTPEEQHCAGLIRRSLEYICATTDEILATVAANAFGFSEGASRQLTQMIEETEVLCRRCDHCLVQCSSRATAGCPST